MFLIVCCVFGNLYSQFRSKQSGSQTKIYEITIDAKTWCKFHLKMASFKDFAEIVVLLNLWGPELIWIFKGMSKCDFIHIIEISIH